MKKHILTTMDLPPLEDLFHDADGLEKRETNVQTEPLKWKRKNYLGCIFSEPSIRTRWSFTSAFNRLGGRVISSFGAGSTSAEKGESYTDMLMTASQYVDYLVVRTPEMMSDFDGPLYDFSEMDATIINAGDGSFEHPTQALLDAYTIWKEKGRISDLNIFIHGDMKNSRTIHSLISLLGAKQYNNVIYYQDVENENEGLGSWTPECECHDVSKFYVQEVEKSVHISDVIYLNRVQYERKEPSFDRIMDLFLKEKNQKLFSIVNYLRYINKDAIIMNPGPRREEMPDFILKDPRCKYWSQVKNGMFARMALLRSI